MNIRNLICAPILLAVASCDERAVPGTDYLLTASEVKRDIVASGTGDSEASKRLAFHYGLTAETRLANKYLQRCIDLLNAECFAEQANRHFLEFSDNESPPERRQKNLLAALKFNHLALIYADKNNPTEVFNFQEQGKSFYKELNEANFQ